MSTANQHSSLSQESALKVVAITHQRASFKIVANFYRELELLRLNRPKVSLPLYSTKVAAGFPSPAEEHVEKRLNPNDYLIDQEDATFFVTIQGLSMIELGLMPGDKAVVDRSKKAKIGDVVLAVVDGEFTIKTLAKLKSGAPRLLTANKDFKPIEISEGMQFEIWGVVTGSFRRFR
jgi:DNA polymerase V